MPKKFIERLAVPSIAAAFAVGAAFAAGEVLEPAYGEASQAIGQTEAAAAAKLQFTHADANEDGVLDAREYASLAVVVAELAHLNGFIALDDKVVALPIAAPASLPVSERTRIGAIASRDFYAAAGPDSVMTQAEFVAERLGAFSKADANGDAVLKKRELRHFAITTVRLATLGV